MTLRSGLATELLQMVGKSDLSGFKRKVVEGAASTMVAQLVRTIATFASTIIVARLLTPADYGLYALAAPVTGFALMFQNVGFHHAVVQSRDISETQLSSLFWLNIALCVILAIILVMISPLVGMFYGNPAGGRLVAASSLLVLATAPNPLLGAMLNRAMRFHAQSAVEIFSAVVMLGTTIVAAILLKSYWALLIGGVAATLANTLAFVYFLRWRPQMVFNWPTIAPLVKFGGGVSSYGFSQYLTRNIDNVLLARFWGVVSLGYYDRAYKLMLSPLQNFSSPLGRNLLPVLGRTRDDPVRFRRAYLMFVQGIVLCAVPGVIAAAIGAESVVSLLLGKQWLETGPIFRPLAGAGALLLVNESAIWLFIATGRTAAMVRWSIIAAISVAAGFALGLPWGATGMATAYIVGEALRTPILFQIVARGTPVRQADLYRIHLTTLAAVVAGIGCELLFAARLGAVLHLVALVAATYAGAIASLAATSVGRELLGTLTDGMHGILTRKPRARVHHG